MIMSTLYPLIFTAGKKTYKMVGCTVAEGLHELGVRMVSDFFEMEGWDTYYMGSSMPDANVISAVKEQNANLLAISVTMPFHINRLETLINKIRADIHLGNLKIIVGGHPFNQVPDLWMRVGADGWAKNAREAVVLGTQLVRSKMLAS
jgi:methanogenic corrinoid protein MtbC1